MARVVAMDGLVKLGRKMAPLGWWKPAAGLLPSAAKRPVDDVNGAFEFRLLRNVVMGTFSHRLRLRRCLDP
jgi:hypothetical protein